MWWKYARVGQRVVCIRDNDNGWESSNPNTKTSPPNKSEIFTVRQIITDDTGFVECGVIIDIGREDAGSMDGIAWFDPQDFRPIQDTAKAVEALKCAAVNAPQKAGQQVCKEMAITWNYQRQLQQQTT